MSIYINHSTDDVSKNDGTAPTIGGNAIATTSTTQTLTNKTISADNNTLSGIAASSFVLSNASGNIDGAAAQKVIPTGAVVGTTDTQTLTNKTLTTPTLTLKQSAGAAPTAEGDIQWDTTNHTIEVGDGAATKTISPDNVTATLTNKTLSTGCTWSGSTIAIGSGGTGVTSTPINGQLLIGNGTGYTVAAITQGSGITVTNGAGSVTVAANTATETASGIVELATTAEVQTGTDTGRVPSVSSLRGGLLVSGTAIATTSGTSHDFTGIPSWVKTIRIGFSGVSTNGTSVPLIQIGDSGGIENTGYLGSSTTATVVVGTANYTTGFGIGQSHAATDTDHGTITLTLLNASTNTWTAFGVIGLSDVAAMKYTAGSKSLSATLDRVRLTTVNGTDAFDAGSINIIYE